MAARSALRFDTDMKSLAVRVLSDFGVDGIEPQALGSKKGRLELCVLALAGGQAVPADVLADTLWGDAPPARPDDQLAVLVSRLRSVLGRERIQHRDHGYLLVCDWLDASELAALIAHFLQRLTRSAEMIFCSGDAIARGIPFLLEFLLAIFEAGSFDAERAELPC